jgi:hypothetical protein
VGPGTGTGAHGDGASGRGSGRRGRWVAVVATLALVAGLQPAASGQAGEARPIDGACRDNVRTIDHFDDVAPSSPHAGAIDCLWAYGIVQGRQAAVYDPNAAVTRQQTATFIARALDQILDRFHSLPDVDDPDVTDEDQISGVHRRNVARLHEAGIVSGYTDGTFRPQLNIDRAQMASLLTRAIEDVTGEELPSGDRFDDVGPPHGDNVEKLAEAGVVQGRADGSYDPGALTTRAQMASLVARSLAYLGDEGYLVPHAYHLPEEFGALGLTDVTVAAQAGFDRVTFELDAGEGPAGWRVFYVDEALATGSGNPVDVDGDAILMVLLEGMALPPELDEELWDEERVEFGGAGIVEVVDVGWFEGQHQLFIGTTGLHDFDVSRLADPERVYIDVHHGG